MRDVARSLLLEIARCSGVTACKDGVAHPCSRVVGVQRGEIERFQVPEPWNGDIERAPVLFIGSNPSISESEAYPRWSSDDEQVREFFENRFDRWVVDGRRRLEADGSRSRARPYWSELAVRAAEIFGRTAVPGRDYALTEAVRCKSKNKIGVNAALSECTARYLARTLALSGSRVIVAVGVDPWRSLQQWVRTPAGPGMQGPVSIAGRDRLVLFVGAPGSSIERRIGNVLTPTEQARLRSWLDCQRQ
jgi:hypothetical protein